MVMREESCITRLAKEWCTGPGGKPSSQKPSCRADHIGGLVTADGFPKTSSVDGGYVPLPLLLPSIHRLHKVKKDYSLVRLADSAGFSQPQQYFSLTRNQPAIQPTVFSSHAKSASQPASQPNKASIVKRMVHICVESRVLLRKKASLQRYTGGIALIVHSCKILNSIEI